MRKRLFIIGVSAFLLIFIAWQFVAHRDDASPQIGRQSATTSSASSKSVPSSLSPENYPGGLPPMKDFVDPKVAIIEGIWAGKNAQAQDFYGRVVDQHGKPVAGATITGTLMQIQGVDVGTKKDFYTRETDKDGNFEFTGLHGWQLGVVVKKVGYQMGQGTGFYQPPNQADKSSPKERAIFHMWKLQGAEPMVHTSIQAGLACDGTPRKFDVLTGRRDTGDLVVTLTRNPVNIDRSKPFDWNLTLGIAEGGLIEIADPYPNQAPISGYQSSIAINMPTGTKGWTASLVRSYYIFDGKNYSRITINIMANYQPPPTHFEIDSYVNPSGSRNLEFDPAKQVR